MPSTDSTIAPCADIFWVVWALEEKDVATSLAREVAEVSKTKTTDKSNRKKFFINTPISHFFRYEYLRPRAFTTSI